jgi:hypothetical protein
MQYRITKAGEQFHIKPTKAHLYYSYHFISTVLLGYVSTVKGPSSEYATYTFSQPDQHKVYQSEHVDPLK